LAANTVAAVYMERNQQLAAESRSQAAQWFTTHLDELRQKVQKAQQDLYVYRAKHGSLTGAERKTVASHALTELNTQSVKAEMAKAEARSRLEQIQAAVGSKGGKSKAIDWSKLDSQSQVLGSHLIQTLRAQEITMSAQVAELSEKYGSLHPKLTRAKAELTSLRERIGQELQKIYGSVRHDYDAAVVQDRAIKDAIKRYNADKIKLERDEVEYGMLEREVESSQHLYDIFLKTTKEADVSAGMHANNVYLADSASVTTVPARPRTKLNILLAVLSGLMSGTWLAIALEGRGKTLRAPADVERYIPDVSLLGIVPMIPKSSVPQKSLVQPNAMTPVAENIRIIRAHLLQMKPESLPSRVLITSPGENEGKTTLAVNLAIAMAQLQRTRVVLVNVDFRGKQSHPVYDVGKWDSSPRGLAQFLQGDATLSEVVHQSIFPNLMVVPQGGCPHNPTELLYSDQMSQLLDWALDKNCHLILDGPPVLPVADAAVLASKVDGVLMVVSAGETTREACRQAIQRVTLSGGTVLGVVMQKARPHDVRYVGEMVQAHA
jgi:capsular exopolysaccharide synthesis family protein